MWTRPNLVCSNPSTQRRVSWRTRRHTEEMRVVAPAWCYCCTAMHRQTLRVLHRHAPCRQSRPPWCKKHRQDVVDGGGVPWCIVVNGTIEFKKSGHKARGSQFTFPPNACQVRGTRYKFTVTRFCQ